MARRDSANVKRREDHWSTRTLNRLRQPRALSPQRLENLKVKLFHRVDHEMLRRFTASCRQVVRDAIEDRYGVALPARLQHQPYDL